MTSPAPQLDARETHARIPGDRPGRTLFLRHLPPAGAGGEVVLYVHGGTFPSALSVAYRFDGRSWRDELSDAGFHVWALDFQGFGLSDRSPEMNDPADAHPPLGRAKDASAQLERAVRFICEHHHVPRLSIIAHSRGSIVSGHFAGRCPLFGALRNAPVRRDSKIARATHLIHLEENRYALYRETETFLKARDTAPSAQED